MMSARTSSHHLASEVSAILPELSEATARHSRTSWNDRLTIVAGCTLFHATLLLSYRFLIAPGFGRFYAYPIHDRPFLYIVLCAIIAVIPGFWLPPRIDRPTQTLYWLLYLIVFVPTCIVPMWTLASEPATVLLLPLSMLVAFAVMGVFYKFPLLRMPAIRMRRRQFWTLIFILAAILYVPVIRGFGLTLNLPTWFDVYDVRADYSDTLRRAGAGVSIAVRWLMYAINPLFMAVGVSRRNLPLGLLGVFGELLIFGISGFKSAVMLLVVVAAFFFLLRNGGHGFGRRVLLSSAMLVVVTAVIDIVFRSGAFTFALPRRIFIVPGLLTGYYYEFFSENGFMWLGHMGFLSRLFGTENPYRLTQPFQIGAHYFGNAEASANANFLADGFSNFGFVGLLIFAVVIAVLFYIYDSISVTKDYWLPRLLLAGPLVVITNSALVALLVGHGFLFIMLLAFLMPSAQTDASRLRPYGDLSA